MFAKANKRTGGFASVGEIEILRPQNALLSVDIEHTFGLGFRFVFEILVSLDFNITFLQHLPLNGIHVNPQHNNNTNSCGSKF